MILFLFISKQIQSYLKSRAMISLLGQLTKGAVVNQSSIEAHERNEGSRKKS